MSPITVKMTNDNCFQGSGARRIFRFLRVADDWQVQPQRRGSQENQGKYHGKQFIYFKTRRQCVQSARWCAPLQIINCRYHCTFFIPLSCDPCMSGAPCQQRLFLCSFSGRRQFTRHWACQGLSQSFERGWLWNRWSWRSGAEMRHTMVALPQSKMVHHGL